MRILRGFVSLISLPALVLLAPASGRAQVCAGLPSLHERAVIVTADASRGKDAWSGGMEITAGRSAFASAYGGVNLSQNVDFAAQRGDAHSIEFGAGLGYELRFEEIGICPIVTAAYETGPDGDFGGSRLNSDGWTVGGGVGIGGVLVRGPRWGLIPFASASYNRVTATVHDFPFVGTSSAAHETGWVFSLGAGIRLGPRLTLTPSLTIPTGFTDNVTSVDFSVSIGLGH